MSIRREVSHDIKQVFDLNSAAFPSQDEAVLVNALRDQVNPFISLVYELDGSVIGHIMFSPLTLDPEPEASMRLMGLAPMAVAPAHQKTGVGSQLVIAGLKACEELSIDGVVVLGHPDYYPKFGFRPASCFGLDSEYDVPDDVFMALELKEKSLENYQGKVLYHSAFQGL